MKRAVRTARRAVLPTLCSLVAVPLAAWAGDLEPPGPPGPTMTPLNIVEPRIPIRPEMLPFTITQPGSYYLTGHVVTSGGGITIDADNVTLDLMGFTLAGGTGHGVYCSPLRAAIRVRNGTVRGWSLHGVALSDFAVVDQVLAVENQGTGIEVGYWSAVTDTLAHMNAGDGIRVGGYSLVSRCKATGNGEDGIEAIAHSQISDSLAVSNDGAGFLVGSGCSVVRCLANLNDWFLTNGRAGIWVTGDGNRVEDNHLKGNNFGITIDGDGNVIARNVVAGSLTSNFEIATGSSANICDIRTDLTGAGPWSNFSK